LEIFSKVHKTGIPDRVKQQKLCYSTGKGYKWLDSVLQLLEIFHKYFLSIFNYLGILSLHSIYKVTLDESIKAETLWKNNFISCLEDNL
jgi:hypothetical protein